MIDISTNNELMMALDIYAYLLEHRHFTREKNNILFDSYADEDIQKMVKIIAQKNNCEVELISRSIYLLPHRDNKLLSYTKSDMKNRIFSGKSTDMDFYLANFIILELLTAFYNSTSEELAMFQISYNDLENRVHTSLKLAQEHNDLEALENENNLAFINIISKWDSLKGSDKTAKTIDTRYGFMCKVLAFLQKEHLITWYEADSIITPTSKLTDLVRGVILQKSEFKKVEQLFKTIREQEMQDKGDTIDG